jgi:Zn-finger nucleic acid-binding protein
LVVVEREGIELDWCLDCRGLWFDEGELELLAEKSGRAIDLADLARAGQGKRRCPRCRKKMEQATVGSAAGPKIDCCPAHGIWLDRGELGQIMSGADGDSGPVLRFLGETFGGSQSK